MLVTASGAVLVLALAAASHFGGVAAVVIAVLGAGMGIAAGVFLGRRVAHADRVPANGYLMGLAASLAAVALRWAPSLFGSENQVFLFGRGVVVGELATVLALIGTGTMLSSLADDSGRMRGVSTYRRPVVKLAGLAIALLPLVPFLLGGRDDLGPLVVLVLATVVMGGRSLDARWFIALAGAFAVWAGVIVVSTVAIARDRLADTLSGGYQLDLARLAIGYGGLLWGGGFEPIPAETLSAPGFAEQIPVAGSDHLAAYLAGTIGVIPALAAIGVVFVLLARLARGLGGRPSAVVVVATGLVTAATAQLSWTTLGSFGVLPLTGLAPPVLAASGSSWAAWGLAAGFIGVAAAAPSARRAGSTAPVAPGRSADARLRADAVSKWVTGGIRLTAVFTLGGAVIVGGALVITPPTSGMSGVYSTMAPQGALRTADGEVLAASTPSGVRAGAFGADAVELTGLVVPSVNHWGLEKSAAPLTTCGGRDPWSSAASVLVGPRCLPADVVTSVNSALQRAAVVATAEVPGSSVLVLDGATLDVLAAYSSTTEYPRPDPAGLSETGSDFDGLDLDLLSPDEPDSPYFPTVLEQPIAPGSVFKVPVLAVAAESGITDAATLPDGALDVETIGVQNSWGGPCPGSDVVAALTASCNDVSAALAAELGQDALAAGLVESFGIGAHRTLDGVGVAGGGAGLDDGDLTAGALARTAIGLQSVRLTMLELGVVIAHATGLDAGTGTQGSPGLITAVCRPGSDEAILIEREGAPVGAPLHADTIALVREGMSGAAHDGTASGLLDLLDEPVPNGMSVLAKTGTPDHEIGGIPVNDSLVAVVIDRFVVVARVPGTVQNPAPDEDSPAIGLAAPIISTLLLELDTINRPAHCSETRP